MTLVRPLTRSVSSALVLSLLGATVTQTLEQQVDEILETEAVSGDAVAQYNQQDLTSLFIERDGSGGNPSVGDSVGFIADTARFEGKTFDQHLAAQEELAASADTSWDGSAGTDTATIGAVTAGKYYRLQWVGLSTTAINTVNVRIGGSAITTTGGSAVNLNTSASASESLFFEAASTGTLQVFASSNVNSVGSVTSFSLKVVEGYHLIAASDAARPVLRQHASGFYYLETDGSDDQLSTDFTGSASDTIVMAVRTSDTNGMFLNGDTTLKYLGCFHTGSSDTKIESNAGSPSYRIDGAAEAFTNRGDVHTTVSDDEWHVVTVSAADLSSWTKVVLGAFAGGTASFWTAMDIAYGPVILPDPSAEDLATIEQAAAAACGVTLA